MSTENPDRDDRLPQEQGSARPASDQSRANRRVVLSCLAALGVMTGITAYSPTLYTIFCQVTGYGGTTQRAVQPSHQVVDRMIRVRFDANVAPGLPLKFKPVQHYVDVKVGENKLAFYRATNTSNKTIKATAGFNVAPETMGLYFSKIECFCFTEQTFEPGQTVEMPLTFFVDPEMLKDADTGHLTDVTLSYVFYPMEESKSAALAEKGKTADGS